MKITLWDLGDVKPYEMNVKEHGQQQVEKIAKAISEFGWDQPIVVDKDGVVIKGHGRRLAAIHLGLKQVPVLQRSDLTEDQVKAARLSDNRVAISNIDTDMLQKELASMTFDLTGIFDKKELDFLEADLGEINTTAFVDDLDGAVAAQTEETSAKIAEADAKDVRIDKALGFKSISGKDERAVVRFMAQIEAESGLTGGAAFINFVKSLVEVPA